MELEKPEDPVEVVKVLEQAMQDGCARIERIKNEKRDALQKLSTLTNEATELQLKVNETTNEYSRVRCQLPSVRFLSKLPRELRDEIYTYLCVFPEIIVRCTPMSDTGLDYPKRYMFDTGKGSVIDIARLHYMQPPFLTQEMAEVFYRKNKFQARSPWALRKILSTDLLGTGINPADHICSVRFLVDEYDGAASSEMVECDRETGDSLLIDTLSLIKNKAVLEVELAIYAYPDRFPRMYRPLRNIQGFLPRLRMLGIQIKLIWSKTTWSRRHTDCTAVFDWPYEVWQTKLTETVVRDA